MMRKVMVLTLVLLMALAGSAMAEVVWSGEFEATGSSNSFKVFQDDYELKATVTLSAKGTAKSETEIEGEEDEEPTTNLNWEFTGGINLGLDDEDKLAASLGKYQLSLYDQYFKAWVWGNGQQLSDKATYFGMISAGKAAAEVRARMEVPVMDLATLTVDFDQKNSVKAFADGNIGDISLGLAFARDWNADPANNIVVGQAGYALPTGDMTVNLKGAVGVDIQKDLGLALGFGADAQVTETVKVEASVTNANDHWEGQGPVAQNTVVNGKVTYADAALQAIASAKLTVVKDGDNANEFSLSANYRMSDALAYDKLFDDKAWFTNTAPAFGATLKFANMKFGSVSVKASTPVVQDMVWLRANATFETKDKFGAGVDGYVKATDKLVLKPAASYAHEGKIIDLKLVSEYKIGLSDTLLTLTVQKVMADKDYTDSEGNNPAKELISATVKVPF